MSMKLLRITPPCEMQQQKDIQGGGLRYGLILYYMSVLLAVVSLLVISVKASDSSANVSDLDSVNTAGIFDIAKSADALTVPAIETQESLKSVILGGSYADERMVFVGERGHILYSDDQGESWKQAEVPVRTTLTSVFFISPEKGWAVGHDTVILATEDGGASWTKVLDGNKANSIVLKTAQQRFARIKEEFSRAAEDEKSALRDKLDFAEISLDEAVRDAEIGPSKPLMDVWFADKNTGIAVGASGYMLRTTDGGQSWQDWSESIASLDFLHFYKLTSNNNGYLFLLGESGQVYRSQDVGLSWEKLSVPYLGSFFGGLSKKSDGSVYIYGLSGVVLKTIDNGDSWARLPTNTKTILQGGTIISGDRIAIVGLGGGMIVELDDKSGFEPLKTGVREAFAFALTAKDEKVIIAGENGLRMYDAAIGKDEDGNIQSASSLHFMSNKHENSIQ